jgi:hypothetical protein
MDTKEATMQTVTRNYNRQAGLTKPARTIPVACHRCGGTGRVAIPVDSGRCWRCAATGVDPTRRTWAYPVEWTNEQIEATIARREARAAAAAERRAAKKQAERDAQWAANVTAFPVLEQATEHMGNSFLADIVDKAHRYDITQAQADAITTTIARVAERAAQQAADTANACDVPEGRMAVDGEVVSTRWDDTPYGSAKKWLVKVTTDAGVYKLWGTVPRAILDVKAGDRVRFTGTLERSHDDRAFGFVKRPTAAEVLGA